MRLSSVKELGPHYGNRVMIDSGAQCCCCPKDYASDLKLRSFGNYPVPDLRTVSGDQMKVNGVKYLHSQQVIHRDLKPEHMILTHSDRKHTSIKITDFGIAMKSHGERKCLTLCGTPMYMAPEVWFGESGNKVDI